MNSDTFKVLNVDDDEAGRYAKTRILQRGGYAVIEAGTGTDTLRIAREESPQLVLLDVMLPDINGLSICRTLKSDPATAHIMILQISATHITETDRVRGLEGGADGYLTEPVEAEELLATVKALLRLYAREAENRQLLQQLRQADQQKDEFLATLAHELRNPLHPIRGAMEIMRLKEFSDPEIQLVRDVIDQQVTHLARLLDDLLDVARITRDRVALRKEELTLQAVLKLALESSRSYMEAHGHCPLVQLPDEPVRVDGDFVRLTQVLVNLLSNAAKYTPEGKDIRVSARVENGNAVVSVKDSGVGISPEHLAKVFDKFYQVDQSINRSDSGLGLGLTLARKLVELHGGTLDAFSEGKGQGSEFLITLPVLSGPASQRTSETESSPGEESTPNWRILIVDDGARTREMYSMLMRKRGHEVETAEDGHSGIEAAKIFRPDVVLIDIGMPGLNGFQTCQKIRAQEMGNTPVLIAVTGWAQREVQEEAESAGFDGILVMPVGAKAILDLAGSLIDGKKAASSTA